MNILTLEALFEEFLDEGQLDEGTVDKLSVRMRDEYFFRGGKGDAGDVEMWCWREILEHHPEEEALAAGG